MISGIIEIFSTLMTIVLVSFLWTMYVKTYGEKHAGTVYDKVPSYPISLLARILM